MPENNICPACLEDLARPSTCEQVMGGVVSTFLIGLKSDVATWPAKASAALRTVLADHIETQNASLLTMNAGTRLFAISAKKGSAELKYELQGESGSKSFKASLECNIPGLRAKMLGLLAATANQELVILAKTKSGEIHLLGDADEGVEYESASATSGKAGTDPSGADVVFSTDVVAPTVYMGGNWDALQVVNGTAATIVMGQDVVSGSGVTLKATATANDSTITRVGFRYKAEGTADWTNANVSSFTSGTEFTKNVTSLASGDYLYYAYMVVDGHEVYTETYAFTISA